MTTGKQEQLKIIRTLKNCSNVEKLLKDYYDDCLKRDVPLTVAGLSFALNMPSQTIVKIATDNNMYAKLRKDSGLIQYATSQIKKAYRCTLKNMEETIVKGRVNPSGSIFLLKHHAGYKDDAPVINIGIVSHLEEQSKKYISTGSKKTDAIDASYKEK